MARSSQEKLEKLYFEGFIRAYPHLPDGKIEFGDRPDVMIFGDDVLGVEIANLYIKHGSNFSSEQRQAHLRLKVIEKAQEEFLKKGYPQYEFWLDFDPECPIENADKLSEKLSSLIIGLVQNQPNKREFYKPFLDCPELRFITYNGVVYSDSKWNSVQVCRY